MDENLWEHPVVLRIAEIMRNVAWECGGPVTKPEAAAVYRLMVRPLEEEIVALKEWAG